MQCPPFRSAVQAIAEPIGQLPIHVFTRAEDGTKTREPDHPAYILLHDEANAWTPASEFREQLTRDAILQGNGYGYIGRVDGRPVELIRQLPGQVQVTLDLQTSEPLYHIAGQPVPRENILHIRAPSVYGVHGGDSIVSQGRETIGLAIVMELHAARLFGNGARPSGMLSIKGNPGADALVKAKAAWLAAHGAGKTGGTAVLPAEVLWQALTLNSVDAQFHELRKFSIEDIARLLRVPPTFLMEYGRATYANSEQMAGQFLTYTEMPWIKRWEGEIRLKLFTPEERKIYFAEFFLDDLLRPDFAARMEGYSKAIAARILNPNEARAAENRPPYAGGEKFENPNTSLAVAA
jgi:HK97 family phage portal protein